MIATLHFRANLRNILHLAWPVFISQIAVIANGAIDTIMAGRLGAVELAGVGVGAAIALTVLVSFSGILLALTPTVAHLHGARRETAIGEEVRQAIWVALGLALIAILLLQNPAPFLTMTELSPEVHERVLAYLDAVSFGVPGLMLFRVFGAFSTGVGLPRAVMRFNLLALLLKVPLNLLLIPHFGGAGCAMATSLLSWCSAILAWRYCLGEVNYQPFAVFARFSRPRLAPIRAFLKLGLPMGATFLVDVSAFTFMALFISRYGAATSAAHQIAANLVTLSFMLPLALGNAASVLAGRALGAGQPLAARQAGIVCLITAQTIGICTGLILWHAAPWVARLYTNDLEVLPIATGFVALAGLYHGFDALQAAAVNVLRGFKRTTGPMLIYAGALWGIGLGGGYWWGIVQGEGARGFWLAATFGLLLAGSAVTFYFLRVSRQMLEHK